ncbi:MAG TPA: hypothetical protein VFH73_02470 [Polyangia bacterium]|nr:hypothetical protein [Polyangia bacterium]
MLAIAAMWSGGCTASIDPGVSDAGGHGGAAGSTPDSMAPQSGMETASVEMPPNSAADANDDPGDDAPDAGPADVVLSACRAAGTELCEDFESGALDPKVWGKHTTTGATITVDQMQAHGGKFALHVKLAPGQSNVAQITDAVTFPAKNNTFYTRAFIYLSPDLPFDNSGGFHMAYLLATGNNDLGFVEAGLASAGNKEYLGYSEYYGAGPGVHAHGPTFTEFGPRSPTHVVPMKWLCMELMQGGNATTTMRRVWVDDKELPEQVSNYTGRKPPQFDLMSIGVLQYHPTPILSDVWIDDIRVSSNRIGCAEPPLPP